jgi:cellulose synthase/poly-beta-1,6-N-acetylglucosamine synthase-like glycosyltransferase
VIETEQLTKHSVSWMFDWGNAFGYEHYWSHKFAIVLLVIYAFCLTLIFVYSLVQLYLAMNYLKSKKEIDALPIPFDEVNTPYVTIQLPIFNELYVAERVIEKMAQLDYPTEKLQIQVLDDSTDETVEVIARTVARLQKKTNLDIVHLHRTNRKGYKAGALHDAMEHVKGEFIAIFDADFLPENDFLKKTIPYFQDSEIGVVQTRWGHINKDYSLLTELQAFGLNGHFAIEQRGRNSAGHFINFNGTGGVWRKTCIQSAGGWQHDTLTEDLDLSYRAQLKGWKFKYLEEVVAPAELPVTMSALKSQQHRWMKGGAECFKKNGGRVINAKNVPLSSKFHGITHLFNSSVFVFIVLLALLSIPLLEIADSFNDLNYAIQLRGFFTISTVLLSFYYWLSFKDKTGRRWIDIPHFIYRFFQFLVFSLGLSLHNAIAVLEGYMGIKSTFVRTPKFNVNSAGEAIHNKYDKKKISLLNILEGLFFFVFLAMVIYRVLRGEFSFIPFHLMLTLGFGSVFFYSMSEFRTRKSTAVTNALKTSHVAN